MVVAIRKAERRKAKLRLGIAAPSGAGKTYGALQIAFGLGGKVGMIDTEHGSGDLYAHLGEYDIISLDAPYTVAKYREAIRAFEQAGYATIIIDSLSHAWAGEGGLLDKQSAAAAKSGNSYTAWRNVTPDHNALVNDMLGSPCHIIATMRAKTEYVQEKDGNGRTTVRKVGLAPVQRDGLEYEFTVMLDVSSEHIANASKDRTGMFTGEFFKLDGTTGEKLLQWLESGSEPLPQPVKPLADNQGMQIGVNLSGERKQVNGYTEAIDALIEHMNSFDSASMREAVLEQNDRLMADLRKLEKGEDSQKSKRAAALLERVMTSINEGAA